MNLQENDIKIIELSLCITLCSALWNAAYVRLLVTNAMLA